MTTPLPARLLAAGLFFSAALLAAAGCGKAEKPTGTVKGTVKYKGQPLNSGTVNFLSNTGAAGQGVLDESGNYAIEGAIEAGEYTVYLNPPVPGQFAPGVKVPKAPKFDVLPKYQQPKTSGLTATVKAGENVIPFDIKE